MLRNYLTIAFRNLWRNKVFSMINIFGFAIAIAFAILIGSYVWDEFQVNKGLKDYERLYILETRWVPEEMSHKLGIQ